VQAYLAAFHGYLRQLRGYQVESQLQEFIATVATSGTGPSSNP
jgi:hypothetical protein